MADSTAVNANVDALAADLAATATISSSSSGGGVPAQTAAGKSLRLECDICLSLLTDNVTCPQCLHGFCKACLGSWLQSQTLFTGVASCPSCRLSGSISQFVHDAALQQAVDEIVVLCEYDCGAEFAWRDHAQHVLACPEANVPCPFSTCTYKGPRTTMDEHTYNCPASRLYIGNPLLSKMPSGKLHSYEEIAEVLKSDKEEEMSKTKDGRDCVVHHVLDSDTLSGLSVRYGISKEEIRRVNGLIGDNLFTNNTLLIPVAAGYVPQQRVQLSPEVVAALQKRRLVREVVSSTGAMAEEAIAYLQMCSFDARMAIQQFKDDEVWEKKEGKNKAKTLSEFLNKTRADKRCHGCPNTLTVTRKHCVRCGRLFCQSCVSKGQCSRLIMKHELGTTDPSSLKDTVPVCNACYRCLR